MVIIFAGEERPSTNQLCEDAAHRPYVHRLAIPEKAVGVNSQVCQSIALEEWVMQLRGQSRRMHAHRGSSHADPSGSKRSARVRSGCARDVLAARQKQLRRPIPPRDHVLCELLLYRNRIPAATPARVKRENCKNRYCIAPTARIIIVSQAPVVIWGSHGGAQARGAHTGGSSCARVRKCGYGGHSNAYETRAKPKSQIITSQFSFTSCMQSSVHSVPGLGHALPGNG